MSLLVDAQIRRGGFTFDGRFEVEPGQTCVLVGPNGSGKSTLVAAISGEIGIDSGQIRLGDRVLDDGRRAVPSRDRGAGVMFQDLLLFEHLSVLDNVAFGPRCARVGRHGSRAAAMEWIEKLGIAECAPRRPSELSGGQAQRVALARALAASPEVLILDEPLSALDAESRPAIRRLLAEVLAEFAGVKLVITHDPVEAMALADRLVVLDGGRVVQVGTPEDVRQRPRAPYSASLVGTNLLSGTRRDDEEGALVMIDGGGSVRVPGDAFGDGSAVYAAVHPRAVAIALSRPETSARNVLGGDVREVSEFGGRLRVRVGTVPELTAEITPGAGEALGVRVGARVWVSFKATEVAVYAR